MTKITSVKQSELDVMLKASLYLREKLLKNGRNGPLVKLLTREIDVFNDELDRRIAESPSTQTTSAVGIATETFTANMQQPTKTAEKPTAPLQHPASNGASKSPLAMVDKTEPARPNSAPAKAKVSSTARESSLLKRVQSDNT